MIPDCSKVEGSVRAILRKATAWLAAASFAAGLLLPAIAGPAVADPDCGPVLSLAHSTEHFEAPIAAPTDHCALCHLWNAMANASVTDRALAAVPDDTVGARPRTSTDHAYGFDLTQASPRGPPARS